MSYWSVGISQGTVDTHGDMEEQDGESSVVPAVNPEPYCTLVGRVVAWVFESWMDRTWFNSQYPNPIVSILEQETLPPARSFMTCISIYCPSGSNHLVN